MKAVLLCSITETVSSWSSSSPVSPLSSVWNTEKVKLHQVPADRCPNLFPSSLAKAQPLQRRVGRRGLVPEDPLRLRWSVFFPSPHTVLQKEALPSITRNRSQGISPLEIMDVSELRSPSNSGWKTESLEASPLTPV